MKLIRDFGQGLGSSQRFKPRWWQRRAYIEGLRDAQRIVEAQAWAHCKNGLGPEQNCRDAARAIYKREVQIVVGHG